MNDTRIQAASAGLPAGYLQSRERFRELGARLGVAARRFAHEADEAGEGLSTDTLYLGAAEAPTLVVIASGTHGVEGYAGAACQFRFLEQYRQRFARSQLGYLLVHAVNPWGYLHDRRVTREGVDLNRNFIDFPSPPAASAYAGYHALLVGSFRPLPHGWANELRLLRHGLTPHSRRQLQAAITAGQYDCADGLFYGGAAATASRRVWEQILSSYGGGRRRAVLLDIHTGLGQYGHGELISTLPPDAAGFRQIARWFGDDLKSMAGGGSVSAAVAGTLSAAFERALGPDSHAVGLEFGTRSALAVLYALRFDQWLANAGSAAPVAIREQARRRMKAAFAPSDPAWCLRVLARFEQVMTQLLAGLERG